MKDKSYITAADLAKLLDISVGHTSNNTKNPIVVIRIDHGYGNIKTANTCFRAGVTAYDKEPFFITGSLHYNGKWYGISEEHKEFIPDKMTDRTPTAEALPGFVFAYTRGLGKEWP